MSASRLPWLLAAGGVAFAVVGLYVWKKGGVQNAAQAIGSTAVEVVGGVTSGAVGAVGQTVGLPTPSQTVTDPAVVRWIIDNVGQWEASKWGSAWAFLKAQTMSPGSGTRPPAGTPAGAAFAYQMEAANWVGYTQQENERLLARYPVTSTPPPLSTWDFRRRYGEI